MRYTPNFHLPLWDMEDPVQRGNFSGESEALETALSTLNTDLSRAVFRSGSTLTNRTGSSISISASQVFGLVQIVAGSYTGTGTYGDASPTRIRCVGVPRFMIISTLTDGIGELQSAINFIVCNSSGGGRSIWMIGNTASAGNPYVTVSGRDVSISAGDPFAQMNASYTTYGYFYIY